MRKPLPWSWYALIKITEVRFRSDIAKTDVAIRLIWAWCQRASVHGLLVKRKCGAASVGEWNKNISFIKRVEKGWMITTVKDLESLHLAYNREIVGCCRFIWECGIRRALPLVETWWHEFVNKLVEWESFVDPVWIELECTQLKDEFFFEIFCGIRIARKLSCYGGSD